MEHLSDCIVHMYQDRLKTTCLLMDRLESHTSGLSERDCSEFKYAVHKLVGTAGYFDDEAISDGARHVEQLLNGTEGPARSSELVLSLGFFKTLLTQSLHFRG